MSDLRDSAWPHEEPPADFADRVMARIGDDNVAKLGPIAPRGRSRWARPAAAAYVFAAAAAILFALRPTAPAGGEARAETRREIAVGGRAVAVAEPGAHLKWRGDEVTQDAGDIFYRVERGERFVVHTPAGDVAVLGTCFRVRVGPSGNENGSEEGTDMNARDMKVGLASAASALLATVVVYEGKVAISHAGQTTSAAASATQLTAGQSARLDSSGVHVGAGAGAKDGGEGSGGTGDESLLAANANLSQAIGEYNRRLNAITAEKATLQQKLTSAQEQLAASGNDANAPLKDPYDLSTDDWKQLAAKGTVRIRMPCLAKDPWSPTADELQKMGLAPSDGPAVHEAYVKANQRIWADMRPLCAAALGGDAQVADRLGVNVCMNVVQDTAGVDGSARRVAEMRAGLRPLPGAGDTVDGPTRMMLDLTHEQQVFEADLASSFGPDEAHRILYGGSGGCFNDWTEGDRDDVLKQ